MDEKRREVIDAIVAGAWRLPPGQRDSFLEQECASDAALRLEVESIVRRGDSAEVVAVTSVAGTAAKTGLPPRTRLIGPYEVDQEIGRGGMGIVLRARDPRLGRIIALKALPAEFPRDPRSLARLRAEARALAAIAHANVAVLHDLQEHEGTLYLVMELVDGPTLRERLRRGALPLDEALSIGAQVAAGLGAAHEQGIVHRDLKPDNVKLTARGTAKVLDFGIALRSAAPLPQDLADGGHAAAAPGGALERVAQQGGFAGTPGYCAPEQLRGEAVEAGADLFALGCLLFECIEGRPAFPGRSAVERARRTLDEEPAWDALPVRTPPAVVALLRSCLAKSRPLRPASAADAQAILERALAEREWVDVPAAGAAAREGSVPSPLTTFVGRATETLGLRSRLRQARLVTLTGVGGCGKTRLAIEAVRGLAPPPADGAWLVELAALSDPALVPDHVAASLSVHVEPGAGALEALARHLRGRDALIILDNCEHLSGAAGDVAAHLLRASGGLRVLATSREPLGIQGEQIVVVQSLETPKEGEPDEPARLLQCEAVALFVDRARLGQPEFQLDAANARDVAHICRRLDGIPLALELAAARLRVFTPAELARRLADRFGLLTGGAKGALPRHQALQATMDWSHDLLAPAERTLLRRLAVFSGGFTLEAAEESAAGDGLDRTEVAAALGALADKSLVVAGQVPGGRYRMLETVRQYALSKLIESGESVAVRGRHARAFLGLAERALPGLGGPDQAKWLAILDPEQDNVRAALDWFHSRDDDREHELRLALALWQYRDIRGAWREGRECLDAAVARASTTTESDRLGSALRAAGWLARQMGDRPAALTRFEQALSMERTLGVPWAIAATLLNLGIVAADLNDVDAATRRFKESLALFRSVGHDAGIAAVQISLGLLLRAEGHFDAARACLVESEGLLRRRGDTRSAASARLNLAELAADEGKAEEARCQAADAIAVLRAGGDLPGIAEGLTAQARIALAGGDTASARLWLEEALPMMREIGYGLRDRAAALECLGLSLAREGNWIAAQPVLLDALEMRRAANSPGDMTESSRMMALALLAHGRSDAAARLLGSALAVAEHLHGPVRHRPAWSRAIWRLGVAMGADAASEGLAAGAAEDLDEALAQALSEDAG